MEDAEKFYETVNAVAPRSNCVLDNSKIQNVYKMRNAYEAIEESLKNWTKE
jgi:hypothetical protein